MTTRLDQKAEKKSRKPRADSLRNREKLLVAARDVFSAGGPDASLEAVARTAGVGIGTLYRHFPTREALFQAVYRREVDQLEELADRLSGNNARLEALRQWLHALIGMVATKKGMVAALSPTMDSSDSFYADSTARMKRAIGRLTEAAIEGGEVRDDISGDDVMRAVLGICYTREQPDWQETVTRLVDVFVDGMRRRDGSG